MRHQKKRGMKLGTDASHTKAMKKSLVAALLANDRIKTTLPRAKAIRGNVDRVITWAKKGDLHSRRLAIAARHCHQIPIFHQASQTLHIIIKIRRLNCILTHHPALQLSCRCENRLLHTTIMRRTWVINQDQLLHVL